MKKTFTRFLAALALLVCMTPSMVAWGQTYNQISSIDDVTTGDYVIAAYDGSKYYALSNTFAAQISGVEITVTSGTISSTDAEDYIVTITKDGDGRISISNGTDYLNCKSAKTDFEVSSTAYMHDITKQTDNGGGFLIKYQTATRAVIYRKGTINKFGNYSTSNVDGDEYYYVQLFKYSDGSTPSITLSETALTGFNYVQGAGPSASQSFKVSGTNLGDNITVSLDENSKYEMSEQDGDNWSSITSKTLTPTSGTVGETTLYVRMKSGLTGNDITGTITAASADATSKTISLSGSVTPTHTATFSVNGATTSQVYAEGATITFPSDPAAINGMAFMGWVDEAISGTTTTAPTYVNTASTTMGNSDVTYYAVFANSASGTVIKTDELTLSTTGVSGSGYSSWTGKKATNAAHSDAVYSGCNAGGNSSIQLNASTNTSKRGIISTKSGGKLKKVTITWNSNTTKDRSVTVYGKNKAYTTMSDFDSDKGTPLGTITKGTSTELTITCDSTYVGFYATAAIYMDKISIDWETTGIVYNYCTTIVIATKEIEGYTNDASGWYLIASPTVLMTPTAENGFLTNTYDLYYFDQSQESEWVNYKDNAGHTNVNPGFNLEAGKGYLYANSGNVTLKFTGVPYSGNGEIELAYSETNENNKMRGWNLVGNPFGVDAEISDDYYMMNADGTDLIANEDYIVAAMQGVFVHADSEGETVIFDPQTRAMNNDNDNKVVINISRNCGIIVDRAIIRFGEGRQLLKMQLFENSTKLYIPQNNKDYAMVRSNAQGEMPVNFKASQDGQYTITVNSEGVEVGYLHLIDNIAGKDVDLLSTPSYTFNAKGDDYESRFRLVFSTTMVNAEMGEDFAFMSDGQLVIANEGEAILQVIDVTGRVVAIENINGTCSKAINAKAGVYVLRLINGTDVKTQKMVIR